MNSQRRGYLIFIFIISLIEFGLPLIWRWDTCVFSGKDETWHLENAWLYYDALWANPDKYSIDDLFSIEVNYPPLIYLASTIPQIVTGKSTYPVIYLGLLPFYFLLNLSLYLLGKKLYSAEVGFLSVILLSTCPILIVQSGQYTPQIPLAAWMPLLYLSLVHAKNFAELRKALLPFLILGLAFLTYMWAFVIGAVFFLYFIALALAKLKNTSKKLFNLALGSVIFIALVGFYLFQPDIWDWFAKEVPKKINPENVEPTCNFRFHKWLFYWAAFPFVLGLVFPIFILGVVRVNYKRKEELGLLVGIVGSILLMSTFANVYFERLSSLVALSMPIASAGLLRTNLFLKHKRVLYGLVIAASIVSNASLSLLSSHHTKRCIPDFRHALEIAENRCKELSQFNLLVLCIYRDCELNAEFLLRSGDFSCLNASNILAPETPFNDKPITHFLILERHLYKYPTIARYLTSHEHNLRLLYMSPASKEECKIPFAYEPLYLYEDEKPSKFSSYQLEPKAP